MDFSYDGTTLQTNDGFRETLYWEVLTGKQISNSTRLREIEWNTWSNISGTTFNPVIAYFFITFLCLCSLFVV